MIVKLEKQMKHDVNQPRYLKEEPLKNRPEEWFPVKRPRVL